MTAFFEKKYPFVLWKIGVLLPVLVEVYRSFLSSSLQILGIALEEAVLLVFYTALFAVSLAAGVREKKSRRLLFTGIVACILLLYAALHSLNAAAQDPSLLPAASPSFFQEFYYLIRAYFLPVSLFLSAVLLSLSEKEITSALRGALLAVSLLVIIPTLFGVGFASYADGNLPLAGGYFSWLSLDGALPLGYLTSKGLFSDANAVAAVLFALSPFAFKKALEEGGIRSLFLPFLAGCAAVTVGTKIASLGFFISASLFLLAHLVRLGTSENRKEGAKRLLALFCTVLLVVPLFLFSPGLKLQIRREEEKESAYRPTEHIADVEDLLALPDGSPLDEKDLSRLAQYLKEHHGDHFIHPWLLESYPVEYDPHFWLEALRGDGTKNADARAFKLRLAVRVAERNEGALDPLLGIGHTAGLPYAERDLLGQIPIFGFLGITVLILPYFALLVFGIKESLGAVFFRKDASAIAATLSLGAFLCAAVFSGHVFDTPFSTYLLAAAGSALCSLTKSRKEPKQ